MLYEMFGLTEEFSNSINDAFESAIKNISDEIFMDTDSYKDAIFEKAVIIAKGCITASEIAYLYYKLGITLEGAFNSMEKALNAFKNYPSSLSINLN